MFPTNEQRTNKEIKFEKNMLVITRSSFVANAFANLSYMNFL